MSYYTCKQMSSILNEPVNYAFELLTVLEYICFGTKILNSNNTRSDIWEVLIAFHKSRNKKEQHALSMTAE